MTENYSKKRDVLEQALEAFQKTTGILAVAKNEPSLNQITIGNKSIKFNFVAEVKLTFNKYIIAFEAGTRAATDNAIVPKILVTRFVTPQMAEQLKTLDMPFIDTAGNAYLNQPQKKE